MSTTMGGLSFLTRIRVPERKASQGPQAGQVSFDHVAELVREYEQGSGQNRVDAVYSVPPTVISGAATHDLRGSLTSLDGSAVTFPIVMGVWIKNLSTTPGQTLTIGAGSNPWITWLGATGDAVVLGPGGMFGLWSPIDGYATTAATGDILTVTPSASLSYSMLVVGRSA